MGDGVQSPSVPDPARFVAGSRRGNGRTSVDDTPEETDDSARFVPLLAAAAAFGTGSTSSSDPAAANLGIYTAFTAPAPPPTAPTQPRPTTSHTTPPHTTPPNTRSPPRRSRSNGCTHPSCVAGGTTTAGNSFAALAADLRQGHRRDNRGVDHHSLCCDGAPGFADSVRGRRPGCPAAAASAAASATSALEHDVFSDRHGLRCYFVTINANGRHVPSGGGGHAGADWFEMAHQCHLDADGIRDSNGVGEVGSRQRLRHLHFVVHVQMDDIQAHRNAYARLVRDVLGMGSGEGKIPGKVQVKLATTPAGAMAHVAKVGPPDVLLLLFVPLVVCLCLGTSRARCVLTPVPPIVHSSSAGQPQEL